jgi:CTP synthase (UTP-ammonia lyase)
MADISAGRLLQATRQMATTRGGGRWPSLVGHEVAVDVRPDSLAGRLLAAPRTLERYHCSYGLSATYPEVLRAHDLRFTGHDADGEVRIAELPGHPFFLASLFQPELAGEDAARPHALVGAFVRAAGAHAAAREAAVGEAAVSG